MQQLNPNDFKKLPEEEQLQLIALYLNNKLSQSDEKVFSSLLADQEIKEKVELCQLSLGAINMYASALHTKKVAQVLTKKIIFAHRLKKLALLTSVFLVITSSSLLLIYKDTTELIQAYQPSLLELKQHIYPCVALKAEAQDSDIGIAYSKCEYEKCISLYEKLQQPSDRDHFYVANSYLFLEKPDKAKTGFAKAIRGEKLDPTLLRQAKYYKAMLLLLEGQVSPQIEANVMVMEHLSPSLQEHTYKALFCAYLKNRQIKKAEKLASEMPNTDWLLYIRLKLLTIF